MTVHDTDIEDRQNRHQIRARRARWAGRMLIPVFLLLVSAALWSDPKISQELERGLAVIAELMPSKTAPDETAPVARESADLPSVSQLPQSQIKVNRLP